MNIDSPFEQWRLKYMKGTAASRDIMELLALAFEGGRVAEREVIAVLVEGGNHVHPKAPDAVWAKTVAKLIRARGEPNPAFKNYMGDNRAGIV